MYRALLYLLGVAGIVATVFGLFFAAKTYWSDREQITIPQTLRTEGDLEIETLRCKVEELEHIVLHGAPPPEYFYDARLGRMPYPSRRRCLELLRGESRPWMVKSDPA